MLSDKPYVIIDHKNKLGHFIAYQESKLFRKKKSYHPLRWSAVKMFYDDILILNLEWISNQYVTTNQVDLNQKRILHFGSEKNELTDGMISEDLLRTNFLTACSAYLSPSAKLSNIPAVLFSLVTLYMPIINIFTSLKLCMNKFSNKITITSVH